MNVIDKAVETQVSNLQKRAGKTLDELFEIVRKSKLTKNGEIRDMLKKNLGMGHGDANLVANLYLNPSQSDSESSPDLIDTSVSQIYSGSKQTLLPLHDAVMKEIHQLGEFEISPKKTYLSLRRKKQFAMVGPGSKGRLEIGLNMRGVESTDRLIELPAGGMCQYKVWVTDINEIDDELLSWIRIAFDSAG